MNIERELKDLAHVVSAGDLWPYGELHQRRRRQSVRRAMDEAMQWLEAGLSGTVTLTEALCTAASVLRRGEKEILLKSLDEDQPRRRRAS